MAGTSGVKQGLLSELHQECDEIRSKVANLRESLDELDDNKKRWLLVGIGLHTVIPPALRKYISPRLDQLWQTLRNNSNIDTQQQPNQLKSYQSTNLNYEAINNNKQFWKNHQSLFDYTVRDSVDLSKLFLDTHMAQYTAFDESCDLSALLRIIIKTGICPSAILVAEKVRSEVRNTWAHCNFTEWSSTKYTECLDLMFQLIKCLGLSTQEEMDVISELDKWKQNGQKFLAGTTSVDLTEITTQIQTMTEDAEMIAFATPEQIQKRPVAEWKIWVHSNIIQEHYRKQGLELENPSMVTGSINDLAQRIDSLDDLKSHHKRWLLVGIGLHTVISPTLRKYISPRLDHLWQTLRNNRNIDIQMYPNQLKSYLAEYLNYEAINNNKVLGQRQQSRYDYKVRDSVDLSKLFLQSHRAQYTAFDESCDLSALLGIIIKTGICPSARLVAEKNIQMQLARTIMVFARILNPLVTFVVREICIVKKFL